ncbi:uncharacterized protein LOC119595778 [Penaeus monodon]|uniref:uncharacterized protein LOC119595778 n=1 Tax=Penaeus monodon TaxID=6687 RepID=UPI0018A7B73B|nr:uncharacterized protein LOC119595778 [Penaeus monodon]
METVTRAELWCQCQGNASAVPQQVLINQQMSKLHADAQRHVMWYVGTVLTLYFVGLILIIRKSGRSERLRVASALALCFSASSSPQQDSGRTSQRRGCHHSARTSRRETLHCPLMSIPVGRTEVEEACVTFV